MAVTTPPTKAAIEGFSSDLHTIEATQDGDTDSVSLNETSAALMGFKRPTAHTRSHNQ
jgi:hypothetical protein